MHSCSMVPPFVVVKLHHDGVLLCRLVKYALYSMGHHQVQHWFFLSCYFTWKAVLACLLCCSSKGLEKYFIGVVHNVVCLYQNTFTIKSSQKYKRKLLQTTCSHCRDVVCYLCSARYSIIKCHLDYLQTTHTMACCVICELHGTVLQTSVIGSCWLELCGQACAACQCDQASYSSQRY